MGKKTTGEEEEEKENEKEEEEDKEERKPSTFAGNGSTDEDKKQDGKRSYVEGTEKQTEGYRADSSTNTATLQQDVACAVAASRRGNSANSKGAARSEHENAADAFGKTDTAAAYNLKDDDDDDDDDETPLHLRSGFAPAAASNNSSNNNGGAGHGRRATEASLPPGAYHVQPGMSATRRDSVDMMDISDGLNTGGNGRADNSHSGSGSGSGSHHANANAFANGNGNRQELSRNIHASEPSVISALTFNIAHVENGGNNNNNNNHNNAGSSGINGDPAVEAYAVTPDEEATQAVVLDTVCGVERKRFMIMGFAALLVLAIVLGIAIPISQRNAAANANGTDEKVCGPICGADVLQPPNLDRVVLGKTCKEWNRISLDTPLATTDKNDDDGSTTESDSIITNSNSSCDPLFQLVAYGCGCPSSTTSDASTASSSGKTRNGNKGCGMLCTVDDKSKSTKEAPFDPSLVIGPMKHFTDKILMDGYNTSIKSGLLEAGVSTTFTCGDWELLSLFEMDDEKCPAYNALGHLCGCQSNQPHPDACGPLCEGGEFVFSSQTNIYGATCEDWDKLSRFLPSWYGNPNDEETCEEHFFDVKYGCACPESRKPPPFENEPECGALCQQLRTCPPICGGEGGDEGDSSEGGRQGSQMVDPSKAVQRESCYGWEMLSRVSPDPNLCPFYGMMGAQCGCEVEEPENSFSNICGAFCGGDIENIPDVGRMVAGETCGDWYYKSTYLPVSHGSQITDFVFNKLEGCDEIKRIQFGCGCNNVEPPEENCGRLCGEDSELADPSRIVGGVSPLIFRNSYMV